MALTKEQKKVVVQDVKDILAKSKTVVFANFHKLPMNEQIEIRSDFRGKNVGYYVAKKTLTKIALKEAGIEGVVPELEGELAIVYADDAIAAAREIYAFQKKFEKRVSIMGGIYEKEFKAADFMVSIAAIPSLNTLHAQFVNLINSPIQRFVVALNAIAEKKTA